jgi:hypothetical protein
MTTEPVSLEQAKQEIKRLKVDHEIACILLVNEIERLKQQVKQEIRKSIVENLSDAEILELIAWLNANFNPPIIPTL